MATSSQAAQHFVLREFDAARFSELASCIEGLWGGTSSAVVRCEVCGFCHSQPFIAGDARFYQLAFGDVGGYPASRWEFQLTRDVLAGRDHSRHSLLEIGAGAGAFIRGIVDDIIPRRNITCTEYSAYGQNQLREMGVKCLSVDVRDMSDRDYADGFDFVCMFQVLEHMDRLDDLFEKLRSLMKKGGSLFVSVPNPRLIEFNELNGALLDMPPNHLGRWNRECFEAISERYGFSVEDHRIEEFDPVAMTAQFINYRFMQQAQQEGSLENRISTMRSQRLRGRMRRLGLAWTAATAKPALRRMTSEMGNSQWVKLVNATQSGATNVGLGEHPLR